MIEHDLDGVGIEELFGVPDRMARGGDRRPFRVGEQGRNRADQPRLDERLVALDVDDDGLRLEPETLGDLGDPVGAGGMIAARHHSLEPRPLDGVRDIAMIGRDIYPVGAALACALRDPHDHRLAAEIGERFPRNARGREARRNDGGEMHTREAGGGPRTPDRLFTRLSFAHFLFRGQLTRVFLEHHRYVVPDRKREPVGLADELRLPRAVDERALADRTDQDVKQARVHECVPG